MALRLTRSKKKKDTAAAPSAPASTHRLEVVHGTLRSDLDGPTELPGEFISLLSAIGNQRVRYERGDLTRSQFGQIIANMMVTTADGVEWTLGATSGLWYKRSPGGPWEVGTPPAPQFDQAPGEDLLDRYFAGGSQLEASLESEDLAEAAAQADIPEQVEAPEQTEEPVTPAAVEPHPGAADIAGPAVAPSETQAPYPVVSSTGSEVPLPTFSPSEAVDDTGVWSSEWESSEREAGYASAELDELDQLEALGIFGSLDETRDHEDAPTEEPDDTPNPPAGYGGLTD